MSTFQTYATSTAFSVSLSKRQVDTLFSLGRCGTKQDRRPCIFSYCLEDCDFRTLEALQRRGLIYWVEGGNPDITKRHGPYVTRAGEAMIPLLELAGLAPNWYITEEQAA